MLLCEKVASDLGLGDAFRRHISFLHHLQLASPNLGALETIVYNLKSIENFGNLNVFCYINEIYLVLVYSFIPVSYS